MHHAPGATLRGVERASECNQFTAFYSLRGGKWQAVWAQKKKETFRSHRRSVIRVYRESRNRMIRRYPIPVSSARIQCTVQQLYAFRNVCGTKETPGTFTAPLAPRRSGGWWGSPRLALCLRISSTWEVKSISQHLTSVCMCVNRTTLQIAADLAGII